MEIECVYSILKCNCSFEENKLNILIVGDDSEARIKVAVALAEMKRSYSVFVCTTKTLPLKNDAAAPQGFNFVVFLIDTSNKSSLTNVEESMHFIDCKFFMGRSCLVALQYVDPILNFGGCNLNDIKALESSYNVPLYHVTLLDDKSVEAVTGRILNLMEIGCGLKESLTPSVIESMAVLMQNPHQN